jgi:hypothetical protein
VPLAPAATPAARIGGRQVAAERPDLF